MTIAILTAQIGYYHAARYRAVAASGEAFTVIATQNEADFSEFLAPTTDGYPVRRLFAGRAAYEQASAEGLVWPTVQSNLSAINPSIVIVPGWATPESFAAIAWARQHRRRIVMLSDSQRTDATRLAWREWIKARVLGLCDAALVAGPSHYEYITHLGLPPEQAFMGYDAVDNEHFHSGAEAARSNDRMVREGLGLPDRYLLASARFIPKKNLLRLITAFGKARQFRDEAPDLVILGDGPERDAIKAAIAGLGLTDNIHLLGFRGYAGLPAFYGLADGFVHVSTSEQWGLVINEAAASGVPVLVSSACGATASIVEDGVTGFVVDARSEDSIRIGLMRIMDLDGPRRAEMGRAGQKRVADWGPERFAKGLLSACDAAKGRPPKGILPWDLALLRLLSSRSIEAVQ